MGRSDARDRARLLLARYLGQLAERGEREIYVSEEAARALRDGLGAADDGVAAEAGAEAVSPPAGVPSRRERGAALKEGLRAVSPDRPGGSGKPRAAEPRKAAPRNAGPRSTGAGNAGPRKTAAGATATQTAARKTAKQPPADDVPAPEIVDVTLAFTTAGGAPDMFKGASPLETCASLDDVEKVASKCENCELAAGRNSVVFGVGDVSAKLMFIGEAPGRDEDIQGIPFVGRAGQLLNKILDAAGIGRDDVYIANIIKCRPPNNRTPLTSEIEACIPYLAKQVGFIKPRIICTLGLPATQTLLGIRGSMGSMRGKLYRSRDLRVIPTYHPAAALRDPKYKRPIWDDFLLIKREYERK
jgi:DNA polymerase